MLSSLPLVSPRDSHTLWYTRSSTYSLASSSSSRAYDGIDSHNPQPGLGPVHLQQQSQRSRNTGISPLVQLALDEQSVAQRKVNIQRFGATWIRPPGMAKTYQGELDDRLEREEAQTSMMDDMDLPGDGTFDLEEDGEEGLEGTEHDLDAEEEEEVSDLDAEIPEGESYGDYYDEEEDEEEENEGAAEVDLDAEVPEAEEETIWGDDSDEEGEEEEEDEDEDQPEFMSVRRERVSTRENTTSFGVEDSQQAMFSHDESPEEPRNSHYGWRARAQYRRDMEDSMDVDSD